MAQTLVHNLHEWSFVQIYLYNLDPASPPRNSYHVDLKQVLCRSTVFSMTRNHRARTLPLPHRTGLSFSDKNGSAIPFSSADSGALATGGGGPDFE